MVAQTEVFTRQPDGGWLINEAKGLDAIVTLDAIDCTLALVDVYEKVELKPRLEILPDEQDDEDEG